MEFSSILKGIIAEATVAALLREAGETVLHSAVEGLYPVLQTYSASRYAELGLGPEIRLTPDLLAVPPSGTAKLIDVKFRSRLDLSTLRHLSQKLSTQQAAFPETYTILARGCSPRAANPEIDDLVRVLPPHHLSWLSAAEMIYHQTDSRGESVPEIERLEPFWRAIPTLTSTFETLRECRPALDAVVPLLTFLARL